MVLRHCLVMSSVIIMLDMQHYSSVCWTSIRLRSDEHGLLIVLVH